MNDNILVCEFGTLDIPVLQEQPKFCVDLSKTNILLFGGPLSGKTTFVRLLTTILHKQCNVETEEIFILDFGGALKDMEELPLVAACFDNSNEEYVKRVFNLLDQRWKDNVRNLGSKNYGEGEKIKHTTLIIDNVNAFLDEPRYGSYQDKLARLCRDGLSKGISVVLTASLTKGMGKYIGMSSFKQKIVLEMPKDAYTEIFSRKVFALENYPGHGYANVTERTDEIISSTFDTQMPYELKLNFPEDIYEEKFRSKLKGKFQDKSVKKYKRFPEVLTEKDVEGFLTEEDISKITESLQTEVCIGLDYEKCKPVTIDFGTAKVIAIYGKKDFGKTNLLARLVRKIRNTGEYKIVLFDDGRNALGPFANVAEEYFAEYKKTEMRVAKSIHSVDSVLEETKTFRLSPFQDFIKFIHDNCMDLIHLNVAAISLCYSVFGEKILPEERMNRDEEKNIVFVLQSKYLYANSVISGIFFEHIFPLMVARAEEMNWIFIFSDVKPINNSDSREIFNACIDTAFLLDNIAEFVNDRGGKSVFGAMDVKSLKEEYAQCEKGDGYVFHVEKDELIKAKFIREDE